jgi:hypothetical protein
MGVVVNLIQRAPIDEWFSKNIVDSSQAFVFFYPRRPSRLIGTNL